MSRDTLTNEQIAVARKMYDDGATLGEVASHFGRSIHDFGPWLYMEHPSMRAVMAADTTGRGDASTTSALAGAQLIAAERERQMAEEGWTPEHDDDHRHYELAKAGATYALYAGVGPWLQEIAPLTWPWEREWFKPAGNRDRIRDLVKAGALIAAEIDRLSRLSDGEA